MILVSSERRGGALMKARTTRAAAQFVARLLGAANRVSAVRVTGNRAAGLRRYNFQPGRLVTAGN